MREAMPRITISYRRSDAAAIAGRIFDRLSDHYGADSVFIDIDGIPFGVDFRAQIDRALNSTDVLLAIVGRHWAEDESGRIRIREHGDPVRVEIEAALRLGVLVIPILVEGATMPPPDALPDDIARFSFLNAAEVESGREFHPQLARVVRYVDRVLAERDAARAEASQTAQRPPPAEAPPPVEEPPPAEPPPPVKEPPPTSLAVESVASPPPQAPPATGGRPVKFLAVALLALVAVVVGVRFLSAKRAAPVNVDHRALAPLASKVERLANYSAIELGDRVTQRVSATNCRLLLAFMYGPQPTDWWVEYAVFDNRQPAKIRIGVETNPTLHSDTLRLYGVNLTSGRDLTKAQVAQDFANVAKTGVPGPEFDAQTHPETSQQFQIFGRQQGAQLADALAQYIKTCTGTRPDVFSY